MTLVAPGDGVPDAPYDVPDQRVRALARRARPRGRGGADPAARPRPGPARPRRAARLRPLRTGARRGRRAARGGGATENRRASASTRCSRRRESILLLGDAFVCASERQRDHWLGALAGLGRVTPDDYADDPALQNLVARRPVRARRRPGRLPARRPSRACSPASRPDDRLLLWGGGIWDWFDPLTVIRAVGRLVERRDDVRLLFLGLAHPSTAVAAEEHGRAGAGARCRARPRGLVGVLQPRLGPVRRAPRVVRRGRPRRQRAPRHARGQARVPHEAARPHRRRARRSSSRAATSSPTSSRPAGSGEPSPRATSTAGWPRSRELLDDGERLRGGERGRPRFAGRAARGQRAGAALADLIERVAAAPRRPAPARTALAQAALAQARSSLERRGVRATVAAAARALYDGRRR